MSRSVDLNANQALSKDAEPQSPALSSLAQFSIDTEQAAIPLAARATTSAEDRKNPLALDNALIQQTKDQIREIVEMIALLARAPIEPAAFLSESLPKIVTAMGADGAGLWQWTDQLGWVLIANSNLPNGLIEVLSTKTDLAAANHEFVADYHEIAANAMGQLERLESELHQAFENDAEDSNSPSNASDASAVSQRRPSIPHLAILDQVRKEQQPTLIPPGSVQLAKNRPVNPTSQLLIYSPIPIPNELGTYWLQVVQPPSGGPSSQRGFLRFVSQMADLVGDYLKTYRLRLFERDRAYLSIAERTMSELSMSADSAAGLSRLMGIVREHAHAEHVFLVRKEPGFARWKVLAAAGLTEIDSKAAGIRQVQQTIPVIDSMYPLGGVLRTDQIDHHVDDRDPDLAGLLGTFAITEAHWIKLASSEKDAAKLTASRFSRGRAATRSTSRCGDTAVLITWSGNDHAPARIDEHTALVARLGLSALQIPWWKRTVRAQANPPSLVALVANPLAWPALVRTVVITLVAAAILAIPVPLYLTATAILMPSVQQHAFAPSESVVDEILVEHGQQVTRGQVLLRLKSPSLSAEYNQTIAMQLKNAQRMQELDARLLRGAELSVAQRNELEGERETLIQLKDYEDEQLQRLKLELDALVIVAKMDGVVATWNIDNLLRDRPLHTGQWLFSLHEESTRWVFESALPERDMQAFVAVADSLTEHPPMATLTSHPRAPIPVRYVPTGFTRMETISDARSAGLTSTTVVSLRFEVDPKELPPEALMAGATARIHVPAGKTSLCWALSRDFLLTLWAKARLWI